MPRVVFLFFFLSGLSALIFEVSWVRELGLFLGNTAQATSTVLAVFMAGLALGAYVGGKQADRLKQDPLLLYGILEICVGAVALLVGLALQYASDFYVWLLHLLQLHEEGLIRFFMAIVLLLLPTILMGATLPVLVRFLEAKKLSAKMFSFLYGVNTLGAAAGGLSASFLGFPYIGIQGTLFCAAALNITIGVFAAYLGSQIKETVSANTFDSDSAKTQDEFAAGDLKPNGDVQVDPSANPNTGISLQKLCVISFLIGFTALSYEVLWTRILRCFLSSTTYSFAIMVSMFLLGLAGGSFLYEQLVLKLRPSVIRPFLTFCIIQYLAALSCAGCWLLFPLSSAFARQFIEQVFVTSSLHGHLLLYTILVSAPTILVPAIFIGLLFPMIGTLAASKGKHASTYVGTVYAINTIGCVCGSLICGLLLVPTIGSRLAFRYITVLSVLTGALGSTYAEKIPRSARLALLIIPALSLAYYMSIHPETKSIPGTKILAAGEDSTGIIYAIDVPFEDGITLNVNGNLLASTFPPGRRYMRLLGHLPMLMHKNPENVLVGCFGTGTTAGALSLHPELKRLDIVDLSKVVLSFAPYFSKTNYDVLKKKNVFAQVNDARNFLLTTDRKYDVITFEPPPPADAGVVNLYTEDFYRLVYKRLKTDGLMCQWIPLHLVSTPIWKMMIASARAVFPFVTVWMPNDKQAILLASSQPQNPDFVRIQERIDSTPQLKRSLHDVGFDNAMAILSTYVAGGSALDKYIKDSPSITDNYPKLEFFLAYPGPNVSELDAESIGNTNVREFVAAHKSERGFDQAEFWKNWQAIHLLREIEKNPKQADLLIDQALTICPTSLWFKYATTHRHTFYPHPNFDYR